jgi:hypothetical protein
VLLSCAGVTTTQERRPVTCDREVFFATDLEIHRRIRYHNEVLLSEKGGAHVDYHVDDPKVRVRRPARYVHLTLLITSASSR